MSRSSAGLLFVVLLFTSHGVLSAADQPGETTQFTAGEELARSITLTTGVPISPLLGVSGLGAWRYFGTPEAARAALPWYARPWFWGGGFFFVFLFTANTTIGALVPGLKKPMDFVEEHENKLSALIATPAVLLEVKRLLGNAAPDLLGGFGAGVSLHGSGLAFVTAPPVESWVQPLVTVGLAILYATCFFVVFLAFHAIQVLIALSPSALLDLTLRGFRVSLLGLLGFSSWVHPYLGAVLGFAIFFIALLIAGWSFRLTVYGSVFSWEILTGRDGRGDPSTGKVAVFSQKGLKGAPVRSFGRLENNGALWYFSWRPWLVLPRRKLTLPAGEAAVLKGVISPLLVRQGALRAQTLARFPPRYRGREEELARRLGVKEVLDGRIVRGFKAAWRWLRENLIGGSANADSVGAINAGT